MDDELGRHLEGMEARLLDARDARLASMETRLIEKMPDMQTELLRGFEAFSSGQAIRLRKVEGPVEPGRIAACPVDIVESRLPQIELRLGRH